MDASRVDTARPILTPEGGRLTVRVAGPQVRCAAWAIDLMVRFGVYFAGGLLFAFLGGVGESAMLLLIFCGEWFYYALFEGLTGATPGKRQMGLMVVRRDGAPCGLEAALVRNIVRFVDMLPPPYGFGFLSAIASPEFQRLGDRAAGTLVIYGRRRTKRSSSTGLVPRRTRRAERAAAAAGSEPELAAVPLPTVLTGEEEAAILDFAARAGTWGKARQCEVTDRLEPLTGLTGEAGRKRVWEHATWLETHGS